MESISLKKVTGIVVACVIGAYAVSAKANEVEIEPKKVDKTIVKVTEKLSQFTVLKNKFDLDKNGLLSKEELVAGQAEKILNHFSEIDLNTDLGISEQELTKYIANLKE